MQALRKIHSIQKDVPPRAVSRWDAFFADLDLLISVAIARLLVWRTLRTRGQERAARLKSFKLIGGGNTSVDKSAVASQPDGRPKWWTCSSSL